MWGRIKRACTILSGKPVYFNSAIIRGDGKFEELVKGMRELLESDVEQPSERTMIENSGITVFCDNSTQKVRRGFTFPCELERRCMFVFEKEREKYGETEYMEYLISVQDYKTIKTSYPLWDKAKRACCTFFGKPISFNNSYIEEISRFKELVEAMQGLLESAV